MYCTVPTFYNIHVYTIWFALVYLEGFTLPVNWYYITLCLFFCTNWVRVYLLTWIRSGKTLPTKVLPQINDVSGEWSEWSDSGDESRGNAFSLAFSLAPRVTKVGNVLFLCQCGLHSWYGKDIGEIEWKKNAQSGKQEDQYWTISCPAVETIGNYVA